MPSRAIPPSSNLEQYKTQAKEFLKACMDGQPEALVRIWNHHPRLMHAPDLEAARITLKLSDAQVVIAREHAFESWLKFAMHVRSIELANASELTLLASRFEPLR